MSKTIRVIDLLNKIANGEEVPKKIKYKEKIFIYWSGTKKYYNRNIDLFLEFYSGELLNDEVEIIEEQQDIDIQSIKELEPLEDYEVDKTDVRLNRELINKILQWAKQLDKKIKEK